jgi:prevent-host-death family protein
MPLIGVRELKEKAAEILRNVREERAEYIVTHQGKPVAMLLPISEDALEKAVLEVGRQATAKSWEAYARLAEEVRAEWPAGVTTEEVLKGLRR